MKISAFLFLVFCFPANTILAQASGEMETFVTALANTSSQLLEEKLFVHTDKEHYQSGEIMWFKIYNVDKRTNKPLDLSRVAYVELLDNNNRQVMQAKVALDSGTGNGSVIIPPTLPSGNYRLRSYTHWMKNFGDEDFFRKIVTVTNGRRMLTKTKTLSLNYTAQFFPEGGNLVSGIENRVAFKVADQYGSGTGFTGYIIDENNDTAVYFQPLVFGMGNFVFTPVTGKSYTATIRFPDGKSIHSPLNKIQSSGYIMRVNSNDAGNINVLVKANLPGSEAVYLVVHTRYSVKFAEKHLLTNGETVFRFRDTIPGEGVSVLTVFNAQKEPVSERLYFRYPRNISTLAVQADQQSFGKRKKINLKVTADTRIPSNYSLAVYKTDSLRAEKQAGIGTYFWLLSELKGRIENPDYYFDEANPERKLALENLLLTQGWRKFNWKDNDRNLLKGFTYEPEHEGIIIHARVMDTRNGKPVPNVIVYAGAPGSGTNFISGVSNDSGYLKMEMEKIFGTSELVLQTNSTTSDSVYRVDIIQPYSEEFSGDSIPPLNITVRDTAAILSRYIASQVQFLYEEEKVNRFDTLAVDSTTFFKKPDKRYILDDFVRFTTMEEVLREYVQLVNVRKRGNDYSVMVYDEETRTMLNGNPLVLYDGVPVLKMNKLIEIDPLKVRKLEVVNRKYVLGNVIFEGILNFISFNGDFEGYTLDPNATVVDYLGLQLQREFYSPDYSVADSADSNMPDFRTLLYWNPDIKVRSAQPGSLTFFSSDIKGRYTVVIQGMNEAGQCGEARTEFEIK